MKNKLFFIVLALLAIVLMFIFLSDVQILGYAVKNVNGSLFGG